MRWLVLLERGEHSDLRVVPGQAGEFPAISASEHCTVALGGDLDRSTVPGGPAASSTADLVHDAYLRHGVGFFPALRGSFALVVWDPQGGTLLAVRDPMGSHPLFYRALGSVFAASPSADAIAGRLGGRANVSAVAAAAYIIGAALPAPQTLYAGVKRLPQGHQLELRGGSVRVRRYWLPESPPQGARPGAEEYALEHFEEVLQRAVARGVASEPAGVYLSGGLDSASVAASAAEVSRRRGVPGPLALLALLRGTEADEETTQRTVAEAIGLQQLARTPQELLGGRGILLSALEVARTASAGPPQLVEPIYDALALLAKGQGCAAILSGIGGDDWLLPPQVYAADRLRELDFPGLVEFGRAWLGYWPELSEYQAARALLWTFGLRPLMRLPAVRAVRRVAPEHLTRARSARLSASLPEWIAPDPSVRQSLLTALTEHASQPHSSNLLAQAKLRLLDHVTPSLMLENAFAVRDRTGVRILAPLLDPDVVAFLYSAPSGRLVANGRAKAPAAELVGRRVPQFAGSWPRTVYGDSLWRDAFASEGNAAWSEIGGTNLLAELGVVDRRLLSERVASGESVGGRDSARIVRALILEIWLRSRISFG